VAFVRLFCQEAALAGEELRWRSLRSGAGGVGTEIIWDTLSGVIPGNSLESASLTNAMFTNPRDVLTTPESPQNRS
jgi:hypothetical protein